MKYFEKSISMGRILTISYDELSKKVLDLDPQVRFAGVANSKGVLVAGGQKDNVEKFLSDDEVNFNNKLNFSSISF